MRRLFLSVLLGSWVVAGFLVPAPASASGALKTVHYRAYTLRVPSSWPVFRLASDPSACVRFDRHAVYLGRPSSRQLCPTDAVGRTEAILVEPNAGRAAPGSTGALTIGRRGVVVTATWARDPQAIERALGLRSLPAPRAPAPTTAVHADVLPRARAAVHSDQVNVGGFGFDTCSAPSPGDMSTWLASSPFRAVAIYIGGANSACAQPNLSATWVSAEGAAGWQFIPTYVGLQAPGSDCGCSEIVPAQATAEGTAAAIDAVTQAQALGIDSGNPIYFDMEAYTRSPSNTAAVLEFLSAWTSELHAYGFISGVYGSGTSGVTDLADATGADTAADTPFVEPDDIWIADWNNEATTSDPYVPAGDWPSNQRLHQYRGGHIDNYGGVQLDVDTDYLDGATATAGVGTVGVAALPDGTFVSYQGKTYRLAGGAPLYVHSWSPFGRPQPTIALAPAQWQALNAVPANGTFIRATGTGKVYRIAGGAPVFVSSWSAYGGPQPAVVVDRWNILNISSPLSHLDLDPANGTIVEGLPSAHYWVFSGGWRAQTAASSTAVGVSDAGLTPFLESPTVTRDTLSGVAKRDPALRVVLSAGANAPALKTFVLALPPGLSFAPSATTLAKGVVVWWGANGKPLPAAARLSHGKLTITLAAPTRKVLITILSPALYATRALAAAVRGRTGSPLAVTLDSIDAKRKSYVLTLDPRTS